MELVFGMVLLAIVFGFMLYITRKDTEVAEENDDTQYQCGGINIVS